VTAQVIGTASGWVKAQSRWGEMVMKQQAARRSAIACPGGTAQRTCRRERRIEALAVEVLTALGERDRSVRDVK
jgi:hypothetical protein